MLNDTPSNSQDTNAFSMGPNYLMRLNMRYNLDFGVRYNDFYYEELDLDNDRLVGMLKLSYNINSLIEASLNFHSQDVAFDNDVLNDNYNRSDLFMRFVYQRGLNFVEFELGSTVVNFDNALQAKGSMYKVILNNQRTRSSNFQFRAAHFLSDASSNMLDSSGETGQGDYVASTSDVYTNDEYSIAYTMQSDTSNTMFSLNSNETNYNQQINLDQKVKGLVFTNNINLIRGSRFSFEVEYLNTVFKNLQPIRTDKSTRYSVQYSYAVRRNVRLNIDLISESIESSNLNNDFEDSRAVVSLLYSSR